MAVLVGAPAPVVPVVGIDGSFRTALSGDVAPIVQVYGLPGVLVAPAPAVVPTSAPDAVSARVLDSAGTFIAHLPHAQGLRWFDEFNTAGSGSIDYRRYDDVEAAVAARGQSLWAAGNQIMISVGAVDVFRLVLDAGGGYRIDGGGNRIDSWAGMGALGVLNSGMCIPEYGWRAEATDERSFDYGSNPTIGGWYVSSEWKRPVGKALRQSWRWTYKKRHLPKGFKDQRAQWLWWKNPDATSGTNETCYFVYSFTLSQARRVRFEVAGDDTLEFQVDGEIRATTGPGGWKRATRIVMTLSAGVHYVAAKVSNTPGSTGNQNRSGFICSIARLNGNGDVVSWINHSSPSTWKVRRQLGTAPGWTLGQILHQLVAEQQARGCASHASVTFGFGTATDSAGVPWAGRQERSITVGTLALDGIQQLVEAGIDVAMSPTLTLNAWRSRGADRSSWIRIDAGGVLDESAAQLPGVRNAAFARAPSGWESQEDAASIAAVGRRETMITLGSSRSQDQTASSVAAILPDLANPPQTIEVKLSGAAGGPKPYRDFSVGDWVSYRPAGATARTRFRVMSISGEVTESGHPDWTITLYED